MPTNLTSRFVLIGVVLLVALWCIFPAGDLRKPNLKPGIDMVGGTSLLYEIKVPPGGFNGNLAEQVMESLKKRVDPSGVRNLIWRPQGNTRLEIQMPLTADSAAATKLRESFAEAQRTLEATNVRPGEATYVVESLIGEERATRLNTLGSGSETRAKVLGAMATTWDQIDTARKQQDAIAQARLETQFEKLSDQLIETNLSVSTFQSDLEISSKPAREAKIEALRQKFTDFPARLAAMDEFAKQSDAYNKVKGSIDSAADLKRLLKGSGLLEFHILAWQRDETRVGLAPEITQEQYQSLVEQLHAHGPLAQTSNELRWYLVERPSQFDWKTEEFNDKHYVLAFITRDKSMTHAANRPKWGLQKANMESPTGERVVNFTFDAQGGRLFGDLTTNNLQRPLAIVLDDKIISAPNINSPIFGDGQITGGRGGFSKDDADYLVNTLNAGSLPAQLTDEPISEQTVGPQLGEDNLRAGLTASILGLIVVAVFMIVYYHISGIIAVIALVINMVMILGVMSALNATWTLPAVAGIVLTIGMSVDANVLVFERLREEQERGLSLTMALRNAYDRAASAIIDSNAVTAITCLILYLIGSEEVKGFGLTLLIGIVSSMFTALYVTKTLFAAMMKYFNLKRLGSLPLTVPALGRILHPNVDWMSKAKYLITASVIMILAGAICLVLTFRKGELFDIEFSSGTAVQFELKAATSIAEVRTALAKVSETELPSPSVVSVGSDDKTYEIVTPSNDRDKVIAAILRLYSGKLNLPEPSQFDDAGKPLADALNTTVIPIEATTRLVGGFTPEKLRAHIGGAAIVLKNVSPKLTAAQIQDRLEHVRLQPQVDTSRPSQYLQMDVETPNTSGPSDSAVILVSEPSIEYDATDPVKLDQWTQSIARPAWDMVAQAINNPPRLQRVTSFNPQVAGEMQFDAFMALTISLVFIMIYIWLRFGDLKYGTATVVAMLHDTLLVIGFVGLSHYLGRTAIGHALLIEPFRVNLTLVAAVLTVMSYSMVDTIVVFDRIRENRGKFGHVDPKVINDSVSQTLSRTLLTAGTTVMTLFIMYIFGGPGIHGFTFVMLVGILVGTYSSIAIAAPILLIGKQEPQKVAAGRRGFAVEQRKQVQGA